MEEMLICAEEDCQEEFQVSPGFKKLLESNPGLKPPKRCYSCRKRRKLQRYEENQ